MRIRQDELHRLKVAEQGWRVKAAKEMYLKARIERQDAQELLHWNRSLRKSDLLNK